jgi:hypothetical protein
MKKIFALVVFIALSISAYSQSDNWYFSFSMGGSWPSGAFSKSDVANPESGFAKKGFALKLDATYPISSHWGLKGMVFLSTNPVDRGGLGTKLENRMNSKQIAVADADRQYLSLGANSWMWNGLLAGPVYTISFDRIFWDFQVLAGLNVAYLPQQKMRYENPANNWMYLDKNTTTTNASYGYQVGTDFRFPVTPRVNLKIGVDYYRSLARVNYEQVKLTKQGATILTEVLGSGNSIVPIEIFTATIGFVYYLN